MLKYSIAEEKAFIKIEKINGPILLLSATKDDHIPGVEMCEKMIERLKTDKLKNANKHIVIKGGHGEPLKHFDLTCKFLEENFAKKQADQKTPAANKSIAISQAIACNLR